MKAKLLLIQTLFVLFLGIYSFNSIAQDLAADRVALVNFYNATGGGSWTNNTNWNTAATVDTWFGVTVSGNRVTQVSLPNNNLIGTGINSANPMNNLSALTKLVVNNNQLSGSMPYFSNNVLQELNLSNNQLTGSLNYNGTTGLQILDISNNLLEGKLNFSANLKVENNVYSYNQVQPIVQGNVSVSRTYAPQKFKPTLSLVGSKLSVYGVGGTSTGTNNLNRNTHKWYLVGTPDVLVKTTGTPSDSTYTPTQVGTYYVEITNNVATALTLKSNNFVVSTLPIKLLSFKASTSGNASKLEWVSSSEQNFNHYDVQRSEDGSIWKSIGEVKSKAINGNSNEQLSYSFYDDAKALTGTVYYRLNQVDNDGTSEYSKMVSLKLDLAATNSRISIYPNPSKGNDVTVVISSSNAATQLKVIDMLGCELKSTKVAKDTNQARLNLEGIPAGIYKVIWVDGSKNVEQTTLVVN